MGKRGNDNRGNRVPRHRVPGVLVLTTEEIGQEPPQPQVIREVQDTMRGLGTRTFPITQTKARGKPCSAKNAAEMATQPKAPAAIDGGRLPSGSTTQRPLEQMNESDSDKSVYSDVESVPDTRCDPKKGRRLGDIRQQSRHRTPEHAIHKRVEQKGTLPTTKRRKEDGETRGPCRAGEAVYRRPYPEEHTTNKDRITSSRHTGPIDVEREEWPGASDHTFQKQAITTGCHDPKKWNELHRHSKRFGLSHPWYPPPRSPESHEDQDMNELAGAVMARPTTMPIPAPKGSDQRRRNENGEDVREDMEATRALPGTSSPHRGEVGQDKMHHGRIQHGMTGVTGAAEGAARGMVPGKGSTPETVTESVTEAEAEHKSALDPNGRIKMRPVEVECRKKTIRRVLTDCLTAQRDSDGGQMRPLKSSLPRRSSPWPRATLGSLWISERGALPNSWP